MLEFLTALVEVAKKNVNNKLDSRLNSAIENRIITFTTQLEMAKYMGINSDNFEKPDNKNTPDWYRYGEIALQQEIRDLKAKKEELLNTKNLSIEEEHKLESFQTADLPNQNFNVGVISKQNIVLVNPYQSIMIVGFGVVFGLFISIFMAFLIEQKQLGAKETPFSST